MPSHPNNLADLFRHEVARQFDNMERKIKHCVDQLTEKQLWWRPQPSMNSIANLMLHLCGNVRQWIIHGIGGEPDIRERPIEFTQDGTHSKAELVTELETTLQQVKEIVRNADESTLIVPRRVQEFDVTGLGAILDSLTHFQGHTQEIVGLTRQQLREHYLFAWKPKEEL